MPIRHAVEARRFRPGLDYTLATSEEKEARLDVVLGLTPPVRVESDDETFNPSEVGWQSSLWGGWEVSNTVNPSCEIQPDVVLLF
jgi:hypothetical protein